MKPRYAILCVAVLFLGGNRLWAQGTSPREELLSLVPSDSGFCLIIHQLRGQMEKWSRSAWVKGLSASPLGQGLLHAPELQQMMRLQGELKRRLDLDWTGIRDDILGDAVVFAYRPPLPGNPDYEQGLLLVHARRPELLTNLLAKLNKEQINSGELKDLTTLEHRGVKYTRRIDPRSTQYFLQDGTLFALSARESLIRAVIEQRQDKAAPKNGIVQQINRAGAERALISLWVNPRAFEVELEQKALKEARSEGIMLKTFLAYWRPLECIVFSLADGDDVEFKMSLQAKPKDLPVSVRKAFIEAIQPSELWHRFPANAMLTLADQLDLMQMAECLGDFSTPKNSKLFLDNIRKTLGAALVPDLAKDVLPNLGPDWGLCVAAADDPALFPHVLAALAVKPGPGDPAVDQALFAGVQFFAGLAVFDYNRKNASPIRIKTAMQGKVEVRYLESEKVFSPGLQPAWALKDGYLVFASTPDALLRFRTQTATPQAKGEAPLLRLSATEFAKLLRERRKQINEYVAEKNQITPVVANQGLETVLGVLDLVDHVTLLQKSGGGQLTWIMRMRPKGP